MPENPEADLDAIEAETKKLIYAFTGEEVETKTEIEPVAFGLNAIKLLFVSDEAKGTTDELEKQVTELAGVNSVEVTDVRRVIG